MQNSQDHNKTCEANMANAQQDNTSNANLSNGDIVRPIEAMENRVSSKIDGVLEAVKEVKEKLKEAEERISSAEDDMEKIHSHTNALETQVKAFQNKVDDLECRSRRNNLRIVGLPEKEEGQDTC